MNYYLNQDHLYSRSKFQKNFTFVNNIKFNYYLSPLLKKHNFKHAFFTKESSKIDINSQGEKLIKNDFNNCKINQIHSNKIVLTSKLKFQKENRTMKSHKRRKPKEGSRKVISVHAQGHIQQLARA